MVRLVLLKVSLCHTIGGPADWEWRSRVPCDLLLKCVCSGSHYYPGYDPTMQLMAQIPPRARVIFPLRNNWLHVDMASVLSSITWGDITRSRVFLWYGDCFRQSRPGEEKEEGTALQHAAGDLRFSISSSECRIRRLERRRTPVLFLARHRPEIWLPSLLKKNIFLSDYLMKIESVVVYRSR